MPGDYCWRRAARRSAGRRFFWRRAARKFAGRRLVRRFVDVIGPVGLSLGDRLSYGTVLQEAAITRIRMSGNQKGIRTRLEAYTDGFYPA